MKRYSLHKNQENMFIIQKINAWRYPCEKPFDIYENELYICAWNSLKTKKSHLSKLCHCGEKCEPERIEITVRRIK